MDNEKLHSPELCDDNLNQVSGGGERVVLAKAKPVFDETVGSRADRSAQRVVLKTDVAKDVLAAKLRK